MTTPKSTFSRRNFLRSALVAPAGLALAPAISTNAEDAPKEKSAAVSSPVPTRKLGKNGPEVSMLSLGGDLPAYSVEHLDVGWSLGIRYFDTASMYGGGNDERTVSEWLTKYPERRKELFLVTKDHPRTPEQMIEMVDRRLEKLKTSYLDLFFIHGINAREYGPDSLNWPKSDVLKSVADKLKSSGKVKMVGFSCHDGQANAFLNAAAQGGFLDAIMVKYTPFFKKGDDFDHALDACHNAGIGLIAMKTLRNAADSPKRLPEFDKLGLTTHQALLQACWSDPRISAVCNRMQNADDIQTSTAAVRAYKGPLKMAQMDLLRETLLASRRAMCPGCPSCDQHAAELALAFGDISRFVMYYEQDGDLRAREMYHQLSAAHRDASGIDLEKLRDACQFNVDYPEILRRAERYFA